MNIFSASSTTQAAATQTSEAHIFGLILGKMEVDCLMIYFSFTAASCK